MQQNRTIPSEEKALGVVLLLLLLAPPTAGQSTGINASVGSERWLIAGKTPNAALGVYHDHQIHSKITIHTSLMATLSSMPGTEQDPSRRLMPGAVVQLAPTLLVPPGLFIRAGAEAGMCWPGSAFTTDGNDAPVDPVYLNALLNAGVRSSRWELGVLYSKNLTRPPADHPYQGVRLTVSRTLISRTKRFTTSHRWRKPLLPWQEPRSTDQSRKWRAKGF